MRTFRLTLSEFISNAGWGISQRAFPLTAVLVLEASVSEVATLPLISGLSSHTFAL